MTDTPAEPITQAEWFAKQAETALRQGRRAETEGDMPAALRWHERAHRIAPDDPGIALAFALVLLRAGAPGRAAPLLQDLAKTQDNREIWLALASVWHSRAAFEPAAHALGRAVSGHAWPGTPHLAALATRISRGAGYPGWCALSADGKLTIEAAAPLRLQADGAAMRARRIPAGAREIAITSHGRPLLGSPLRIDRIRRLEGIVATRDGGLAGWAWYPGAPDRDPVLTVQSRGRVVATITATDHDILAASPLARPRGFVIPAADLAGLEGPLSVRTPDGTPLQGSPLRLLPPAPLPSPGTPRPALRPAPARPVAIVVPVFGQPDLVAACLDSVLHTLPPRCRVIVVDDASPDAATPAILQARAGRRLTVLRHCENQGFPAAANSGMRAALALPHHHDVILLNSDTRVPPGWIEALRALVHAHDTAGTATPLSNDATIMSYPSAHTSNPPPPDLATTAHWAAQANAGRSVALPTAVGFCMYIRHECLAGTGLFREDAFAQGYGEENDFCRRASALGWTHLGAPGVFVAHEGGQSFGGARTALIARNLAILETLHPGYHRLIARFRAKDTLAPARRRMDALRWRAGARPGAVLFITHASGGGVERVVRERAAAARAAGLRPIVLRSVMAEQGRAAYVQGLCQIEEGGMAGAFPNLRFMLPRDIAALVRLLRADRPERVELHHLIGHHPVIRELAGRLGVPLDIHVHDYAAFCPRISLVGAHGRYCGEPTDLAACDACVAKAGSNLTEPIAAAALQARSAADLAAARRVIVPSADTATRMRRHFPGLPAVVQPLEDDAAYPPAPGFAGAPRHIGIIGGIGQEKGYDVLLECARDAVAHNLNLRFTVFGHTSNDDPLLETGRVFITGPYVESEALALIRTHDVQLAWQPSIWPETWCFTLGLAWRAGLHVAAFDIGAPAERIRRTGRGWLMPLGLPAGAINTLFLGLRWQGG